MLHYDMMYSTGVPTAVALPPLPNLFWMYFHRQHEAQATCML